MVGEEKASNAVSETSEQGISNKTSDLSTKRSTELSTKTPDLSTKGSTELSKTSKGFVCDVCGKSSEPPPGRTVKSPAYEDLAEKVRELEEKNKDLEKLVKLSKNRKTNVDGA